MTFDLMAVIDVEIKHILINTGTFLVGLIVIYSVSRRIAKKMTGRLRAYFMNKFCNSISENVKNEKAVLFASMTELREKNGTDLLICEIGAGNGTNFKYYPQDSNLVCVEPDRFSRPYLEENIRLKNPSLKLVEHVHGFAENMPSIRDNSIDAAVCTCVLCSVRDQKRVLSEVLRILKPVTDGKFYFMEHVEDKPGTFRSKMQNWLTPPWRFVASNCHLNSKARIELNEAGFKSVKMTEFMYSTIFWVIRPWIYGEATK